MISNQKMTDTLHKVFEATGQKLRIYSLDGVMIDEEGAHKSTEMKEILRELTTDEVQMIGGYYFLRISEEGHLACLLKAEPDDVALAVAKMAKLQLEAQLTANQDRFDREGFIKNLLLDNLLPIDVYNSARKLGLDIHARRVCFLIETREKEDINALETVRSMFADSENDFVAVIDENNIILVKYLSEEDGPEELKHTADTLIDMLNTEAMSKVRVAYGNIADEIKRVSTSYKEARLALSVGKIFATGQNVIAYASLGIGRLIYQLPIPMCKMFIEEIFKEESPEDFDEETLTTINRFFENNLNVSETSRKLFIHRNTLVYRLDKLQKNTGLDLRVFDDAITFKIALMVVKYMHYMENLG